MKSKQTKPVRTSMFCIRHWMLNITILATATNAVATVHYVDLNSTNATASRRWRCVGGSNRPPQ